MTVDHETAPSKKRHASRTIWFVAFGVLLIVLFTAILIFTSQPPKLIWLTPTEYAQATGGLPMMSIRYKLLVKMDQVKQFFFRNSLGSKGPSVRLDRNVFLLSPASAHQVNLGIPTGTNAAGKKVWILSPQELTAFRAQLETIPGIEKLPAPDTSVLEGPNSSSFSGIYMDQRGGSISLQFEVRLIPSRVQNSIRLIVGLTDEKDSLVKIINALSQIDTNYAVTLKALIPSSGAIAIDGGKTKKSGQNSYWVILSPVLTDTNGIPVKP